MDNRDAPGRDGPGRLPALGVEREDGETARRDYRAGAEPRDSRADDRDLREVIPGVLPRRTFPVMNTQVNGGPKCRQDHRLKQHPRWKVNQLPDGTFRWTTPAGRSYTTEPTRYAI